MYYFRDDTKSTRSMIALRDALVSCMRTKNFRDVTVSDLSRAAHVSRVTFYRFFSNPTDVLEFLCDSLFEQAAEDFREVDRDNKDGYLKFLLEYLMIKSDFLDTIYRSRRIDLFQHSFSRYIDHYLPDIARQFSRSDADYARRAIAAEFASIIFVWAEKGKKETPEDLLRVFRKSADIL